MIHIDYMDNVGNDGRLQLLYQEASQVSNPDMQDMLYDIYDNLAFEMGMNYATFDIYLFLTKDKADNFLYNVQSVASQMLGGNFITYNILNRNEISSMVKSLFNIHDFSTSEAIEETIGETQAGRVIVPINIQHSDGSIEVLNKTTEEKRQIEEERRRAAEERKRNRKRKNKGNQAEAKEESVDIF